LEPASAGNSPCESDRGCRSDLHGAGHKPLDGGKAVAKRKKAAKKKAAPKKAAKKKGAKKKAKKKAKRK
jgi:hypothetical protein